MRVPSPVLVPLLAVLLAGCPDRRVAGPDGEGGEDARPSSAPPAFLLQGWIWPIASNNARTYDFTQTAQAAGVRTVEVRAWQYVGTLGWQSNQLYSFMTFTATNTRIAITSATGYQESWTIVGREGSAMTLRDDRTGSEVTWYNCSEPGWPPLILASMRGCRR